MKSTESAEMRHTVTQLTPANRMTEAARVALEMLRSHPLEVDRRAQCQCERALLTFADGHEPFVLERPAAHTLRVHADGSLTVSLLRIISATQAVTLSADASYYYGDRN